MIRTLRSADLATGAFMTILGILTLIASFQIAGNAGERVHPRTLPIIVGWMILAAGVTLFVNGWRYRGQPKILDWPDAQGSRRVLFSILLMIVFLALLEPLGFPLSTLIFITAGTWYLGRYRWWVPPLCGALSALTVLVVFIDFLELSFPLGLLELFF
ncbi:MAG: tripartite tricarboxylate transporter TctB family protein [Bacteroidetes bacterium]|nr:tripartite tricarboxylate transporter TctB family protein [Bacteroidota bacterium]